MQAHSMGNVSISEGIFTISEMTTDDKDVVSYFSRVPGAHLSDEIIHALRIGVLCLERAGAATDLDFVKREVERLLGTLQTATSAIPARIEGELSKKIGTDEGQALASIPTIVNGLKQAVNDRVAEIRQLMESEVDPARTTSTLGKALVKIQELLDPMRVDSIQGKLTAAVSAMTGEDGALAATVKRAVTDSLDEIRAKLDRVSDAVIAEESRADVVAQTTLKGPVFEEEVLEVVTKWARIAGCEVEHVGVDNKAGDILIRTTPSGLTEEPLSLVIETKDDASQHGRARTKNLLQDAMSERKAQFGIFVKKSAAQFANEIGEWSEGQNEKGKWLACSAEQLNQALRFALVQHRIAAIRRAVPSVDTVGVEEQINRIRTGFQKFTNINSQVTKINGAAGAIKGEVNSLKADIEDSLQSIEQALRIASGVVPGTHPSTDEALPLAS